MCASERFLFLGGYRIPRPKAVTLFIFGPVNHGVKKLLNFTGCEISTHFFSKKKFGTNLKKLLLQRLF
jgi:hypothetical protein